MRTEAELGSVLIFEMENDGLAQVCEGFIERLPLGHGPSTRLAEHRPQHSTMLRFDSGFARLLAQGDAPSQASVVSQKFATYFAASRPGGHPPLAKGGLGGFRAYRRINPPLYRDMADCRRSVPSAS